MSLLGIPRDKSYPPDAVQCDRCGGWGGKAGPVGGSGLIPCSPCNGKGWLPAGHPGGRKCFRDECDNPIPPAQVAVYCSNTCALADSIASKAPIA